MRKKTTSYTSTTSSTVSDEKWYQLLWGWIKTWWPLVGLFIVLIGAGLTKYVWPNEELFSLMIDLTKAISILMVVIYVIYTRLLALETKKMATASMSLFYSEKGTVRSELKQGNCKYDALLEPVKEISKEIHLTEKKFTEEEYKESIKQPNITSINIIINNLCGRRIQITKIEYLVRHTGSDIKHSKTISVEDDSRIDPWEDKEYILLVAPEGEIELEVEAVYYLDNRGIVNKIGVEKSLLVERIRVPKNTKDES